MEQEDEETVEEMKRDRQGTCREKVESQGNEVLSRCQRVQLLDEQRLKTGPGALVTSSDTNLCNFVG